MVVLLAVFPSLFCHVKRCKDQRSHRSRVALCFVATERAERNLLGSITGVCSVAFFHPQSEFPKRSYFVRLFSCPFWRSISIRVYQQRTMQTDMNFLAKQAVQFTSALRATCTGHWVLRRLAGESEMNILAKFVWVMAQSTDWVHHNAPLVMLIVYQLFHLKEKEHWVWQETTTPSSHPLSTCLLR